MCAFCFYLFIFFSIYYGKINKLFEAHAFTSRREVLLEKKNGKSNASMALTTKREREREEEEA